MGIDYEIHIVITAPPPHLGQMRVLLPKYANERRNNLQANIHNHFKY